MSARLRMLFSRLAATFRRSRLEEEFDDEIRAHLDLLTERYIARGMDPVEARYAARRQFGGMTQTREHLRDSRGLPPLDILWQDIRQAFRQLWRAKSFTASAALTLALGIGATTAVFAVLDAAVLRPLPFPEPERLVAFGTIDQRGVPHPTNLSYPTFFDFRKENQVFEGLASYRDSRFTLNDSRPAIQVTGQVVSWDLFHILRVQPTLGRGFLPGEETPGTMVAVISHGLWKSRFGGDPRILNRPVQVNGKPYTIVGVAPEHFHFPVDMPAVQMWVTLAQDAEVFGQRGGRMLESIGRLKPGLSVEQARQQLDLTGAGLARQNPEHAMSLATTWVKPELDRVAGDSRKPLGILLGAVSLVLLIACANVANLLLARGTERAREFVLRSTLGASQLTLLRQLLLESMALGVAGTAGGMALAWIVIQNLLPLVSGDLPIPRIADAALDGRVLAFSALLALLTSMVFSLAPMIDTLRGDASSSLRNGAINIVQGRRRFRSAIVIGQIALGLVLLTGAEMLAVSYLQLVRRDPGFKTDHLLVFDIGLPSAKYSGQAQVSFANRMFERLRSIPGVLAAASGNPLPLQGHEMRAGFQLDGRPIPAADRPRSDFSIVTPDFFSAMGIPLVRGRGFTARDSAGAPLVMVVNEAFARKHFPGEDPIGKRIRSGAGPDVAREIVGIVGDARQTATAIEADPIHYFPYEQLPWSIGTVVLRTTMPPHQLEAAVHKVLEDLEPQAAIHGMRTGEELAARSVFLFRFPMVLMSAFAAVALILTVTGLYGVLSYAVSMRRREIGVRIALGASRSEVLALILRQAGGMLSIGLVLGSAGAMAGARLATRIASGLQPGDPAILMGACCLMAGASLAAAYIPARRAAAVDPMESLRSE